MRIGNSMKVALLVGAILLLIGNAFIIYRNYDTEWRVYQKQYLAMA
jgi:hypothetical protein